MVSGYDFKLGRSGYIRRRSVAKEWYFWVFVGEVNLIHDGMSAPFVGSLCVTLLQYLHLPIRLIIGIQHPTPVLIDIHSKCIGE